MNVVNNALIGTLSLSFASVPYIQCQTLSCSYASTPGAIFLSDTYISTGTFTVSANVLSINATNLTFNGALHRVSIGDMQILDPMITVNQGGANISGGLEICNTTGVKQCGFYALSSGGVYTGVEVDSFVSTLNISAVTLNTGALSTATNLGAVTASVLSSLFVGGVVSLSQNEIDIGPQFLRSVAVSTIECSGLGVGCSISINAVLDVNVVDRVSLTYPHGAFAISNLATQSFINYFLSTISMQYGVVVSTAYIFNDMFNLNLTSGVYYIQLQGGHEFWRATPTTSLQGPLYFGAVSGVASDPKNLPIGRRLVIYPSISVQSRPSQIGMGYFLSLSTPQTQRWCWGFANLVSNCEHRFTMHINVQKVA